MPAAPPASAAGAAAMGRDIPASGLGLRVILGFWVWGLGFRVIGIMEKEMATIIMDYIGYILRLYWDNGNECGNYYSVVRV